MFKKVHKLLILIIVFSNFLSFTSFANQCSSFLENQQLVPKSNSYFLKQIENEKGKVEGPKFLDPAEELLLTQSWKGTREAPQFIKESFHEKMALIDHQLLSADAGTVKMSKPGSFISFRLNHEWQGKDMSTNMGMPIDALIAKNFEGSNKIVSKTAKGVFFFMHGGGTKTTGHHVAAALSDFFIKYGVVVVSIDAPFHAEGPRTDIAPKEYYKYLRDFRHEFIPDSVPTFIGGHSMGGLHADNIMRLSDDKSLGLDKAFKGLINLSGPMDAAPGKSFGEKNAAEAKINSDEALQKLVPEEERDLSTLLLTQGKTSALSGLSAETFISDTNWKKPNHKGTDYIPTLVLMGERDGLYVGREHIFKEYISDLSNTETHVMGKRPTFKGEEEWTGHMIFDHYRKDSKNEQETFHLIKDFIEKQLETKFEENTKIIPLENPSQAGLLSRVTKEYFNNLAFRKFAKQYKHTVKTSSDKVSKLGAKSKEIMSKLKPLQKKVATLRKNDPSSKDLIKMEAEAEALSKDFDFVNSFIRSTHIPEGENKAFAENNIQERAEVKKDFDVIINKKRELYKELLAFKDNLQKIQNLHDSNVNKILNSKSEIEEVNKSKKEIKKSLDHMVSLQIKMNKLNADLVTKNAEQREFKINPNADLIELYKELDAAFADYNKKLAAGKRSVEKAIGEGKLGEEKFDIFQKLYGALSAFENNQPSADSLLGRLESIQSDNDSLDLKIADLSHRTNQLLKSYTETVTPGLYSFTETTLYKELNKSTEELIEKSSALEPLWKIWTDIWKERPPEAATSLY